MELNNIYNVDCTEALKEVEDGSVDLLLTDPPYNISMRSGFHTMGRQGVDLGEWDRHVIELKDWLPTACSKIKKGGSAVVFNDYKNIGELKDIFIECGLTVKELLIWQKPNPMPRNRDRLYVTTTEVALWAVKGKGWTFNRQRDNYENAIFNHGSVHASVRQHPAEKPVTLLTDLLKIHSNEDDLVLDPFSGSGAISVACEMLDRRYIAFELDKDYYNQSIVRLRKQKGISHGVF
jgi:DNA modification methylase